MEQQAEVMGKVVEILRPFVKNADALSSVSMETSILKDLKVNSARLVDIVLEIEDAFGIAVSDEQADQVKTVGDAVTLIMKTGKA
ncbi:MAG: acyl carrier protein [Myxococcales bacterium]|nr:acyl carrier protein [Myxococcales bacterium]